MTIVPFDTLALARRLRDDAKMSTEQAEGIAGALAEAMAGADVATRADLAPLATKAEVAEVKAEIAEVKAELKAEIAEAKAELKADIADLKGGMAGLGGRIDRLEERVERRAAETEARLIRVLVGLGFLLATLIVGAAWTVIRYLPGLPPHP